MSTWIKNLIGTLEHCPVIILHGNVRDKYIDAEGNVYPNLTALLQNVAQKLPIRFHELVFFDPATPERRITLQSASPTTPSTQPPLPGSTTDELRATAPVGTSRPDQVREPPTRMLARWMRELTASDINRFAVLYYLDKFVAFRQTGYNEEERQTLLWLEKLVDNVKPNHRLILVALKDTMVPLELYTNSPNTNLIAIPMPDKADRLAYLKHRLGEHQHLELVADLTDGLYLKNLDHIADAIRKSPELSARELRRLLNKYRLGEQADYWSALSIEKLNDAFSWFVEEEGVKGQDEAVREVIDLLCMARAGLSGIASGTPSKPRGALFFAGPTGVGKTFLAKKLAKFLFGTEEAFLRFDMSEFKEEHTVSKLIGSPPGYVGYEQGGMLTNAVRQRPFSVILFDEIEKAHPKIMDIFLQILDEGRLTDSRGQTVYFTETVIIFTSNIGTRTTDFHGRPVNERQQVDAIINDATIPHHQKKKLLHEHFRKTVEQFFMYEISRPELLNRIGNCIVPFNFIHTEETQTKIVTSHLRRIKEEFEDRYRLMGYKLDFAPEIAKWLVEKYGDQMTIFGGRGITNAIEFEIIRPLARAVLRAENQTRKNVVFHVRTDAGKIVIRNE